MVRKLRIFIEHLGRNPKEVHFNFKQMRLQSFVGHSGTVRKIRVLDNENSFVSAGHDKSVKLWSLRSTGDGGARTSCQYSYKAHKRPLWDLAFIDSLRLIASVDGSVHVRTFSLFNTKLSPTPRAEMQAMAARTP